MQKIINIVGGISMKLIGLLAWFLIWIVVFITRWSFSMIVFLTLLTISLFFAAASAEGLVHSYKADHRAKMVTFNPYQIYAIHAHYLVSTDIIFGDDEIINGDDIHLGDAASWDVQANRNHLYIKAKKLDAGGNLSVTTNKHAYHFTLSASDAPIDSSDQTLFVKFIYPKHKNNKRTLSRQKAITSNEICRNAMKYNLKYSFTGDNEQAPVRACDDGLFTYFKFRPQVELPAIFAVLPDRKEVVVNYRIENGYVVVERLGKQFTLRNGDIVTSVYNDKYIGDWDRVCKR